MCLWGLLRIQEHSVTFLAAEFASKFPTSQLLYQRAVEVFPSGLTHDARRLEPFPLYMEMAAGSHKWDVDGNEFIDYWMGHGALLLGHHHPEVVEAVQRQLPRSTHPSASTRLEIEWGEWVKRLVPSAERVRFTSSGTEATLMAMRLARGFTARTKIVRFAGHFHGWHDAASYGFQPPFDVPDSVGIPAETLASVMVLPPNDIAAVEQTLAHDPDIAGVILEPGGGCGARIPVRAGFLEALRQACTAHSVVLIFDEVVSGFRYAPGGAQEYFGVTPDLTALAKILAGGLPGGAVAGRADIMALLEFSADAKHNRQARMMHMGTFNANPLSASAGIAALRIAATGEPQDHAEKLTLALIDRLNDVFRELRVPGCAYGDRSGPHILAGVAGVRPEHKDDLLDRVGYEALAVGSGPLSRPLRAAMLLEGVDLAMPGRLSSAHSDDDIERSAEAFARALHRLIQSGKLAPLTA